MDDRVIPTADKLGADFYKPRNTKGNHLKKNGRFIDDVMRDGRDIYDIGIDPLRSKRSPNYQLEMGRINKKGYPIKKIILDE